MTATWAPSLLLCRELFMPFSPGQCCKVRPPFCRLRMGIWRLDPPPPATVARGAFSGMEEAFVDIFVCVCTSRTFVCLGGVGVANMSFQYMISPKKQTSKTYSCPYHSHVKLHHKSYLIFV